MPCTVDLAPAASRQLRKLERGVQARIVGRLDDRLIVLVVKIGNRREVYR